MIWLSFKLKFDSGKQTWRKRKSINLKRKEKEIRRHMLFLSVYRNKREIVQESDGHPKTQSGKGASFKKTVSLSCYLEENRLSRADSFWANKLIPKKDTDL